MRGERAGARGGSCCSRATKLCAASCSRSPTPTVPVCSERSLPVHTQAQNIGRGRQAVPL